MYYEIIIFVIVISLFILFIRKKEKFQCPVNKDPSPNIEPSRCRPVNISDPIPESTQCSSEPTGNQILANTTPYSVVANSDGNPAWALNNDAGEKKLHDKYRYSLPTKSQYSIPGPGAGRPRMGVLNPNSNIIKGTRGWKWYKDGIFNTQSNSNIGSSRYVRGGGASPSLNLRLDTPVPNQEIGSNISGIETARKTKTPQDTLQNNQWLDLAYHNLDDKLDNLGGDPNEVELMKLWGTKWKEDMNEKDRDEKNSIEYERPLNMYGQLNEEENIFSINNQGIKDSTKVFSLSTSSSANASNGQCGASSLGPNSGSIFNPTKNMTLLNNKNSVKNPLDFEKAQYKRKIMLNDSNYNDEFYDLYGEINLDPQSQKANKIHPSSGFTKNQYEEKGDVVEEGTGGSSEGDDPVMGDGIRRLDYGIPMDCQSPTIPFEIGKVRTCPKPFEYRYYYDRPGMPEFSAWYKTDGGGTFKDSTVQNSNQQKLEVCKRCSEPLGCRYPKENDYKYSGNYFESQSCGNGNDRTCQKCTDCGMGTEVVQTDCGEGGGASDRQCCGCTPCPDGTYKVFGCDKTNSYYDNVCKPMSTCFGNNLTDILEQGGLDDGDKNFINQVKGLDKNDNYEDDPGKGKRQFLVRDGVRGSEALKLDRITPQIDPDTGQPLKNPFYGFDNKCQKCDECPESFTHLRGCLGKNDTENTVCQRLIDKNSVLNRIITCPLKNRFYNKKAVGDKIDELNNDLKRMDEEIRTIIRVENRRIYEEKDITKQPKNQNDPNNFKDLPYDAELWRGVDTSGIIPVIPDRTLIRWGCQECRRCNGAIEHKDAFDPGCKGTEDTNCIPHTECKPTQYIHKRGTEFEDNLCAKCACPQGTFGTNPVCDGIGIEGCQDKTDCAKGEYVYSDPGMYGDSTKDRECKPCQECPYGSFAVEGGCRADNGGTPNVCKKWKECDRGSMMIVEPGTATSDTVCQCLEGYELPKDSMGRENKDSNKCNKIKGKCWQEPCHPEARCFDNFTDNGQYLSTVCQCNLENGYIETEDKGFGPNGCSEIPKDHTHDVDLLRPAMTESGLPEKFAKNLTHLEDDYHRNKGKSKHLHKQVNKNPKTIN